MQERLQLVFIESLKFDQKYTLEAIYDIYFFYINLILPWLAGNKVEKFLESSIFSSNFFFIFSIQRIIWFYSFALYKPFCTKYNFNYYLDSPFDKIESKSERGRRTRTYQFSRLFRLDLSNETKRRVIVSSTRIIIRTRDTPRERRIHLWSSDPLYRRKPR